MPKGASQVSVAADLYLFQAEIFDATSHDGRNQFAFPDHRFVSDWIYDVYPADAAAD